MMSRPIAAVFAKFGVGAVLIIGILMLVHTVASSGVESDAPWIAFAPSNADRHEGRTLMERNGCFSCHAIDGVGGTVGPCLNGVRNRKSREELFKWIKSPWSIKPGTRMPQYALDDAQILQIISYLETIDSTQVRK